MPDGYTSTQLKMLISQADQNRRLAADRVMRAANDTDRQVARADYSKWQAEHSRLSAIKPMDA